MKLNWGNKIAIVYIAFVVFTLGMVYLSFGEKFELVTEDYYAKELAYQDQIDKKSRLGALEEKIKVSVENQNLTIEFPHPNETVIKGKIVCFRPSDEGRDFEEIITVNDKKHSIPLTKFIKGKYLIQIDWMANEVTYYTEKTIIIP